MTSNPHFEYATAAFGSANAEAEPEFNEAVRADALIQATLALAYEQRTANLIAMYNMTEANCEGMSTAAPMSRENWDSIAKQIKERLDLK